MIENLTTEAVLDPRDAIKNHLIQTGRMISWVAIQIGISPKYLSLILQKKRTLQQEHRQKINEVLNTNFWPW